MSKKISKIDREIYERLKEVREKNDLTQDDVAEILGTTKQQISKYEKGYQMMGIDKYRRLAVKYDVTLDYLTGLTDKEFTIRDVQGIKERKLIEEEQKLLNLYTKNQKFKTFINYIIKCIEKGEQQ